MAGANLWGYRMTIRHALAFILILLGSGRVPALLAQRAKVAPQANVARAADSAAAMPDTTGSPLTVGSVEIIRFHTRFGSLSPADRAQYAQSRVDGLAREILLDSIPVAAVGNGDLVDIMAGDRIILTLRDQDARAAGVPLNVLADSTVVRLRAALTVAHQRFTLEGIVRSVLIAALALGVFFLLSWLLKRLVLWFERKLPTWRGGMIRGIRIQRLEVLSAQRMEEVARTAVRVLRVALLLTGLYILVPLVIGFIPWTRPFADRLQEYFLRPVRVLTSALLGYLPNLFFLFVIGVVTHYAIRFIRFVFREVERGKLTIESFEPEWAEPTYKIVRTLALAFAAVVAFPYLPGAGSDAFKGISIFFGVLLSLGSSSAISNIVAGVILTYTRAFRIGDRVRIGDTTGDVLTKTLLVTRIRTIKNVDVTVPNAVVVANQIENFGACAKDAGLILHTTVTIGYDVPWRQVHELMTGAALATEGILADPAPFVLQTSLDDFYVSYELNAYTRQPERMASLYSSLHTQIQDAFWAAGVEIASPHYRAVRDGNRAAIPAEHLPPGYVAPSFRVDQVRGTEAQG